MLGQVTSVNFAFAFRSVEPSMKRAYRLTEVKQKSVERSMKRAYRSATAVSNLARSVLTGVQQKGRT